MRYVSTRGGVRPIDFGDAVMMGLADDGGLLVPEFIPDVSGELPGWDGLPYSELAFQVISRYVGDLPPLELRSLIDRSYGAAFEPAVAPTVRVGDLYVMELWHGPTLSFKDVALQLLGNLFEHILARRGGRMNILGATSGDTGSAAICGVRGRTGIHIFVMHPAGRISAIQERQMTTILDDNVHNIAVEGSFDDCQRIMKSLASDLDFKRRYSLGAVNSVNWARVVAQIVYYIAGAFEARRATGADRVQFAVPTGNFGDVLAGWYAMQMGAPISRLVLATNENDILSRFFATGVYSRGEVRRTLSPAMDIQVASNFERYLYYKVGQDSDRLRSLMDGFSRTGALEIDADGPVDEALIAGTGTTEDCLDVIRRRQGDHEYGLDPHTAVGVAVAERLAVREADRLGPVVCLATAHPAKFPDAIRRATGRDMAHHPDIDRLAELPTRSETLPNDQDAVREFIMRTVD